MTSTLKKVANEYTRFKGVAEDFAQAKIARCIAACVCEGNDHDNNVRKATTIGLKPREKREVCGLEAEWLNCPRFIRYNTELLCLTELEPERYLAVRGIQPSTLPLSSV
jgi:hypothetical protein